MVKFLGNYYLNVIEVSWRPQKYLKLKNSTIFTLIVPINIQDLTFDKFILMCDNSMHLNPSIKVKVNKNFLLVNYIYSATVFSYVTVVHFILLK